MYQAKRERPGHKKKYTRDMPKDVPKMVTKLGFFHRTRERKRIIEFKASRMKYTAVRWKSREDTRMTYSVRTFSVCCSQMSV